jgi:glyoxylase-like metal-dependent hydrolase (beta-lactamase superfamily II)
LILPLHAGNPSAMTGSGNWTFLLRGADPVLIDAGVGDAAHLEELARHHTGRPLHVVVTHGHVDHASGVPMIASRWPNTMFSKFPWPDRDERYAVPWQALVDGQCIAAGDDELQVVYTPGHSPDHISLWHAASRTLLCGDLVVKGNTVVIPATSGGSLTQYLASLHRVIELQPARLLPAHGPIIEDPEPLIRRYIDHRLQREAQVLAALREGDTTVAAIVTRIYVALAAALVPMAHESVLAHLIKLRDEGAVVNDGDHWRCV